MSKCANMQMKTNSSIRTSAYPHICTFVFFFIFHLSSFISVFAQVNADFTANKTSGCEPLIVNFTDQSTGSPTSWLWTFGNGNSSTLQNPTAIYAAGGIYTVKLVVSDGATTDSFTRTNYINVYSNPAPLFGVDVNSGCPPLAVQFTDSSSAGSGTITSWTWDFGDGNSSTLQNPNHTYLASGNYNITLSLTNSFGCIKALTFNNVIQVTNAPVAAFTASPLGACNAPLTVNFTDQSTGSGTFTYLWNFGDGDTSTAQNPNHIYNSNGNYTVTLTVSNGGTCSGILTKNNYINITPIQADFGANILSGCAPLNVLFSDSTVPPTSSWNWDFGDGTNSTLQNPSHTYNNPGNYTVKLVASSGASCTDSITKTNFIIVDSALVTNFIADDTAHCMTPFTVTFTDSSAGAVAWLWTFGDGQTSVGQNPVHNYNSFGNFTVSLTATNASGCSKKLTKNNYISIAPAQANFSSNVFEGCIPLTVLFTDLTVSNDTIVNWNWDFGDGNTSTGQNPSNVYSAIGTYSVILIITTVNGCMDTFIRANYIRTGDKPVTAFIANPLITCAYQFVDFTNQTTNATQWQWDFGDGGTSTLQNPSHKYNDTGYFDIMLVANNNGCRDTLLKTAYVQILPPIAIFAVVRNCATPFDVQFNDASIGADSWQWDFGDGQSSSSQNTVHTYLSTGQYIVSLIVANFTTGCNDTQTMTLQITEPQTDFGAVNTIGCAPFLVNFKDSSTDGNTYKWYFGNGATSTQKNPNYTYQKPGNYNVKLVITDVNGCKDSLTKNNFITVLGPTPDFGFTYSGNCSPTLTFDFTDSSVSTSAVVSWLWDFGDGQTSTLQNPSHDFSKNNIYTISLTVTDNDGCSATIVQDSIINLTIPRPRFTSADTLPCPNTVVTFSNTTSGNPTYFWDFGDGDTSTLKNPTHIYLQSGNYTVSLTVTNAYGCDSTLTKTNYIKVPVVSANFGVDNTTATCPPLLATFSDSSLGNITNWDWDFGDGSTHAFIKNPSHTYTTPGQFSVTLIVTNNLGCKDTIIKSNLISIAGPFGTFTFDKNQGCAPLIVFFTSTTTNTTNYFWDFGDGNSDTSQNTSHNYTQLGAFHPQLVLQDNLGCSFILTTPDSIVVNNFSTPISVSDDTTICEGDAAQLLATANGQIQYQWQPANSLNNSTIANPIATPFQTTDYFVTATDTNGCETYDTMRVNVSPLPNVNAGIDATIFAGETTTLIGTASGAVNFNWSPQNLISDTNSLQPTTSPLFTTTYILTAFNSDGCDASDSVIIIVLPPPVIDVPTAFTPNGDNVNDIIYAKGKSLSDADFKIFNRWGQIVFHTADINIGWDGTFNGKQQPMDTYIYHIKVTTIRNEPIEKSGNISLIR